MKGIVFEYESRKVEFENKLSQTYAFGGGKTLLAAPSFPHSGAYFGWLFKDQNLDDFRLVSFDLPGWIGNSDGDTNQARSIRLMIQQKLQNESRTHFAETTSVF